MDEPMEQFVIPLDGSYGAGSDAELTIVTKADEGRLKEVTYKIPYLALDMKRIQNMCDMNLITGYKIVKGDGRPSGLKELGL